MANCEGCIHTVVCYKYQDACIMKSHSCESYRKDEKRQHGEWIEVNVKPTPFGGYTRDLKCSRCNKITHEYHPIFCSNCGARMDGDEK